MQKRSLTSGDAVPFLLFFSYQTRCIGLALRMKSGVRCGSCNWMASLSLVRPISPSRLNMDTGTKVLYDRYCRGGEMFMGPGCIGARVKTPHDAMSTITRMWHRTNKIRIYMCSLRSHYKIASTALGSHLHHLHWTLLERKSLRTNRKRVGRSSANTSLNM